MSTKTQISLQDEEDVNLQLALMHTVKDAFWKQFRHLIKERPLEVITDKRIVHADFVDGITRKRDYPITMYPPNYRTMAYATTK